MIILQRLFLSIMAAALSVGGLFAVSNEPSSVWNPMATSTQSETAADAAVLTSHPGLVPFVEVTDSCATDYTGDCLNLRAGPGTSYESVGKLRNGVVLRVIGSVSADGRTWYELSPGPDLRYPERVTTAWYVAADFVRLFYDPGVRILETAASSSKRIIVDRSEQMLYAYDGEDLYMQSRVSTGLELTPTPRGRFTVFRMTPSRYMQGPIIEVSDQYYDLPGVPWNLYFTSGGAVIHGAYWHTSFGTRWSHGCVNLPLDQAKKLYEWAELGTRVIVQD